MEKAKFSRHSIDQAKIDKHIGVMIKDDYINSFISEFELTVSDVDKNFVPFSIVYSDRLKCVDCKGLNECKKENIGKIKVLAMYNERVDHQVDFCKYSKPIYLMNTNYVVKDFAPELLLITSKNVDKTNEKKHVVSMFKPIVSGQTTKGLYIHGESRLGKSFILISYCNNLVKNGKKVAFINMRRFCDDMLHYEKNDKDFFELKMKEVKDCDCVVLDDLGNENINVKSRDMILYDILSYRYGKSLQTFATSNYNLNDLKALYTIKYDAEIRAVRIVDMIMKMFDIVELTGIKIY